MSAANGLVTAMVQSIDATTAASNDTMDIGNQNNSGRSDPPGNHPESG